MQTESQSRLDELALELVLSSPARTAEFITSENARFKDIIARSNLSKTSESNMSDNLSSASVTVSATEPLVLANGIRGIPRVIPSRTPQHFSRSSRAPHRAP